MNKWHNQSDNHHEAVTLLNKGVVICHFFHVRVMVEPVLVICNVRNFIACGLLEQEQFLVQDGLYVSTIYIERERETNTHSKCSINTGWVRAYMDNGIEDYLKKLKI